MKAVAPGQLWWTAAELAGAGLPDLPGSRQGVELLARRLGWRGDPGLARRREGRGGGWEYHWRLLPAAAQAVLVKRASCPPSADAPEARGVAEPQTRDREEVWARFEALPEAVQRQAAVRLAAIRQVEALGPVLGKHLAVARVAGEAGVSARTVWNWLGQVEGVDPADRLAYLAPRHRGSVRRPARAEVDEKFFDWLSADYLRLARPSFSTAYRRAVTVARSKGWQVAPERTVRRLLDARVSKTTQTLLRLGPEALRRMFPPQVRDKAALVALEAVNADFHRFDVFVAWPGEARPVRPQLVAFQDVYSGRILSWRLDLTANSTAVQLAAGDMVEAWGIPQAVVLDNGREFAAKAITGGAATRFRFKVRDDDPLGLFTALGCEIIWTTPYSGQSKPIERAFRDMCDAIARDPRLDGAWTGNRPDAKPEDYGSRAIPLEEFARVVAQGIEEHNTRQGRRSEVACGRSFAEVFDESYATAPIRKATAAQRRLWLMGAEGLRADSRGEVRLMGNRYWAPWLVEIAGERVIVRFDPADLHAGVHVYSADNRYLGEAECRHKGRFLSVEDARIQARARAEWMRAEKRAAEAHRKLTARELGRDLDAIAAAPAPPPAAKVVRAQFGKPRGTAPAPAPRDDGIAAVQAGVVADLAARRAGPAPEAAEAPRERFRRALEIERRHEAGEAVTPEQLRWLGHYRATPEYRAERMLWADFGEAYFG
jgi:hypothetical protein